MTSNSTALPWVGCLLAALLVGCAGQRRPSPSTGSAEVSGAAVGDGPPSSVPQMGFADRLLLYPTTDRIDPAGAVRHVVPYGKGVLELFVARSAGCAHAEPVLTDLELVGNGSRAEWAAPTAARRWGDRPVEVWALNWPGYGTSTGPARVWAIAPAARFAYDTVAAATPGRPVVVFGHSLGSAAALAVAAHRPVAGLILLNPPPLRQLILGHYGWWNLWLGAAAVSSQLPPDLDSLANGRRVTATPAVFVSSGLDTVVPPRFHRQVFDGYAGPKRWVDAPTADHNTFPDLATDPACSPAVNWLMSTLVHLR